MRSWKRGILIVSLLIATGWLCTGGCVTHSYWLLPSNSYGNDFKPYVRADVKCPGATYGTPYIYQYHGDRLPFGISLTYITHNVVEEPRITLDRVTIKLADGTETDLADRFREGIVPRVEEHWYIDDNHAMQKKPSLMSEVSIEDCVPNRNPFRLRI